MRIVIPRETAPGEHRVALVPESCKKLIQIGYDIAVQAGAGAAAGFPDQGYTDVNVSVRPDPVSLIADADIVVKATAPTADEVACMKPGTIYVGSLMPLRHLGRRARARRAARSPPSPPTPSRAPRARSRWTRCRRWPTSAATRACCSPPSN